MPSKDTSGKKTSTVVEAESSFEGVVQTLHKGTSHTTAAASSSHIATPPVLRSPSSGSDIDDLDFESPPAKMAKKPEAITRQEFHKRSF